MWAWMAICGRVSPVMDWRPSQGVPCPACKVSWDWLQSPQGSPNGLVDWLKPGRSTASANTVVVYCAVYSHSFKCHYSTLYTLLSNYIYAFIAIVIQLALGCGLLTLHFRLSLFSLNATWTSREILACMHKRVVFHTVPRSFDSPVRFWHKRFTFTCVFSTWLTQVVSR